MGATPVPPFAFINNGALTINQYVLTEGQVAGLWKILTKFPEYFDEKVSQVNLNNCKLDDHGAKRLFEGLKQLKSIHSFSYGRDDLYELATLQILDLIKKGTKNKNLRSFSLHSPKTNYRCISQVLDRLSFAQSLKSLCLSGINLSYDCTILIPEHSEAKDCCDPHKKNSDGLNPKKLVSPKKEYRGYKIVGCTQIIDLLANISNLQNIELSNCDFTAAQLN